MYDPEVLLAGVDDRLVPFLVLSAISFVGLIVWYYEAVRVGERDRAYSMPVVITFVWLAHDATLVLHFPDWFGGQYDHWLTQLYWVAMVCTTLTEVFFVVQLMRFGRDELAPFLSPVAYRAAVVACLGGVWIIWLVLKSFINDPLFQVTFGLTAAMYPPCGMALLLRRRSRRGQSVGQWAGFTVAPAFWFLASIVAFGPAFRAWEWIAVGVVTTVWGAVTTVLVARTAPAGAGSVADEVPGRVHV